MTRINTIKPEDLLDQHLFAEFREITRISTVHKPTNDIPARYILGTGHMKFFYNKGLFLHKRLLALELELTKRATVRFTPKQYKKHIEGYNEDWTPDRAAYATNLVRLDEKLRMRPVFYTLRGNTVPVDYYLNLLEKY